MSIQLVSFAQLPAERKPREKLLNYGADFLDDAELLSIIFGTGCKGMNVLDLSRYLLGEFGSKGLFSTTDLNDFQEKSGLPFVKSCQILAIGEYYRRMGKQNDSKIKSPEQLYKYLKHEFNKTSFEKLYIVCIDPQRRVLYSGPIAQGEPNTLQVSFVSIFHHVFRLNAKNFYLAHNHPNGEKKASRHDISFTKMIKKESENLGLSFDDHIIIGKDGFFSFSLNGLL